MINLTDWFHETAIKDGITSILKNDFEINLDADQLDQLSNVIFNKLDNMPSVTDGEDLELDTFYYLLCLMIENMTLQSKVKALEEALG
jgi:hypothetical protein